MKNPEVSKGGKERQSIIPLSKIANSIGSSIFEGNDRDLVWDREIRDEAGNALISVSLKFGKYTVRQQSFFTDREVHFCIPVLWS